MSGDMFGMSDETAENAINAFMKQLSGGELDWQTIKEMYGDYKIKDSEIATLKRALNKAKKAQPLSLPSQMKDGDMGKFSKKLVDVSKVFGKDNVVKGQVEVYTWAEPNHRVPELDLNYIPDWNAVDAVLAGIRGDYNTWIHGPTGCGKDSAINFVGAKLNMPVVNISFDADISRAELIGRDKLTEGPNGSTVSELIEGLLPFGLRHPCILVLDEIDFVREDVAYVMQATLNENKLTILEDGGRIVHRHPDCRIIATANTNGTTDERNLHVGARQQSAAFLDRFNNWFRANYMDNYQDLLADVSGFSKMQCADVNTVIKDYHQLFENGDIRTPLSNRAIRTVADKAGVFNEQGLGINESFKLALHTTLVNRLNEYEGVRATELINKRLDSAAANTGKL